jgi:hypothetical protein
MIDKHELRLLNWIKHKETGKFHRIIRLDEHSSELDRIEPIPLTEEILLKCGFTKLDAEFTKGELVYGRDIYGQNSLDITINKDGSMDASISNEFVLHFKANLGEIKHLHHLQNLYFALDGWELSIYLSS